MRIEHPDTIVAADDERLLNVGPDIPDIRDRYYEPSLRSLRPTHAPPDNLIIRDQRQEGSCVGFAMMAGLNILLQEQGLVPALPQGASPRMLYEMAKLHDEWAGEMYSGSSIRGAIKGMYHNGSCREADAPYRAGERNWALSVEQAKSARRVILGSYYRLRANMVDYHAALAETGVIVVSARLHSGWMNPRGGIIDRSTRRHGGHAFVIIGYDEEGFIVQNSWGEEWGGFDDRAGTARWNYFDWAESVMDAWVLRLAVPTPKAFELTRTYADSARRLPATERVRKARRQDVIGHVIHVDDGALVETGKYGTPMESLVETARLLRERGVGEDRKYNHLLFYAHGGLTSAEDAARLAAATRDGFKRNGIYPVHFLWETGALEELGDVIANALERRKDRVEGFQEALDWLVEKVSGGIGRALWREMKADAKRTFATRSQSFKAVKTMLDVNDGLATPYRIHIAGHSAGSNFTGEFLNKWGKLASLTVDNCFLLAPACTVDQYDNQIRAALEEGILNRLTVYNLNEERELDDTAGPYSKSLLYLVSAAFEEAKDAPILGMEAFSREIEEHPRQEILYAGRDHRRTDAMTHGGYGADLTTLNDILKVVVGDGYRPSLQFRPEELAEA